MRREQPRQPSTEAAGAETKLVTTSGITVLVHERPCGAPAAKAPEPPRREPQVIIVPDNQPASDRAAFIAGIDARWGRFIQGELSRYKDVAIASRPDVHQNVLIILCEHYDKQKKDNKPVVPYNVRAFLRKVIHNEVQNHGRKKRRRVQIDGSAAVDEAPDAGMNPEQVASRAQLLAKVEQCSAHLTPEEREVFEAREVDQMTFEIIATACGRPLTTVRNQHERALCKLRELLAPSARGASPRGKLGARLRRKASVDSRNFQNSFAKTPRRRP